MITLRIDTHAHLYNQYRVRDWCDAAATNLKLSESACGALIVVDREGQNSFDRLRSEVPHFGEWREGRVSVDDAVAEVGEVRWGNRVLMIVRGAQYISQERLEVLALGVARSVPDGAPATELVDLIHREGGVACVPWSPGKWLGRRGRVVSKLISSFSPRALVFGDISIRSSWGPCSWLLWRAHLKKFSIVQGTDPLPRVEDCSLVGSFGIEISVDGDLPAPEDLFPAVIRPAILSGTIGAWGSRNSPIRAIRRFISTL